MRNSKQFFVYILTNERNTTFYIGVTNDILRRTQEHKQELIKKSFTRTYNLHKLVYIEAHESIIEAIAREKQLKNWHQDWKVNLIRKDNPKMKDLYNTVI